MRKLAILAVLVLGLGAVPALAATGPQPPLTRDGTFFLRVQETSGPAEVFADLVFAERPYGMDGWDFGGRAGYGCGFAEMVDGGTATESINDPGGALTGIRASLSDDRVIARVVIERYDRGTANFKNDSLYSFISSSLKAGNDIPCLEDYPTSPDYPLGAGIATDEERSRSVIPGEPTGPPPHAIGHIIHVFQDGVEVGTVRVPHQEPNPDVWWFRGDEPGELTMWYLETDTGEYGIVARLSVVPMAPGVTATDTLVYACSPSPGGSC